MQELTRASTVRLDRQDAITVITINNPPVNAGSQAVRQEILNAISHVAGDSSIEACVLIGANDIFIAGSDIREFGQPLAFPELPDVISAIERCVKPVVAAIGGAALGGGFELSLACDARVALASAKVGLPEITLGMIPGAGGTQRLPRLAGLAATVDLITTGRRIDARAAFALGIVDVVVDQDLREAAVRHAISLAGIKRRVRDMKLPNEPASAIEAAMVRARRKQGQLPIGEALEAILMAQSVDFDEALLRERKLFHMLRMSERAASLRHLFFAERTAQKLPELALIDAVPITRIGVIGAGTMGSGIAAATLDAGYDTILIDADTASVERGRRRITEIQASYVRKGRRSQAQSDAILGRLTVSTQSSDLHGCELLIEAIVEEQQAKARLFQELATLMDPNVIFASNTSYLNIDILAQASGRPSRFLGLHFFAPAEIMRLLEIVRTSHVELTVLKAALAVAKRLDKIPVLSAVSDGFIGNRIYSAYRSECEFMLEEGALPEQIDDALEALGFAMGPFKVGDLSGLDIAWRNRQRLAREMASPPPTSPILERLCEAGRMGRKSGNGWYHYADGKTPSSDSFVHSIIKQRSTEIGQARQSFRRVDVQHRALASIINEAACVLEEGIARGSSDIDLVMVHGYGFPASLGGPMFWAENHLDEVEIAMSLLANREVGKAYIRRLRETHHARQPNMGVT
jgi:3-hydroxyacyl-CoA dehydrogenase